MVCGTHATLHQFRSPYSLGLRRYVPRRLQLRLGPLESLGLLLATLCLALNWFGDSLDGTLAQVRNRQRPRYGFYVDHMIDSFGALFLMGGLAASGYIDWRIAMGLLVAFLLLSIESYPAS
jgi:archaetidylinositol phosphate synthase